MSLLRLAHRAFYRNTDLAAAPLRCEDELLLCAARARMNPETAARMRSLLQSEMDWKGLIAAARRHGLAPLLCLHLHSACADLVPAAVLLELGRRFAVNSARNLSLTAELVRILALFEGHGIAALPFKGPLLAESIYEDLALREFEDLDILVPEPRVAEAEALLRAEGYFPTLEVPQARLASYRRLQYEIPYRHPDRSICIELHWKIAPVFFQFSMDMAGLWSRAEWTSLAGSQVRNLSKEDALLILCAHGSRHFWEKLEWVVGIAELIRTPRQMNWDYVFDQARDFRSERVLLLGLFMAHTLLGAEFPEPARQAIRNDKVLGDLAAEAHARLFVHNPRPISAVEQCLHMASLTDRLPDGILMMLRTLFLPRYHDWITVELPTYLSFLYYPLRLFRLLRKHALASLASE